MKNKVLVELIIPELEKKYNVYLPINKKIGNIILLLNQAISDIDENHKRKNNSLYNRETGFKYTPNTLLFNSDIRNGTALVLI